MTDSLVSIAEAAKRVGVSRRTIERWVRDGLLEAVQGQDDRRERLVEIADVEAVATARKRSTRRTTGRVTDTAPTAQPPSQDGPELALLDEQEIVDQVLALVYSQDHRVLAQLYPPAFQPLSLEQLRQGPLAHDLQRLAKVARGDLRFPKVQVLMAIQSVLQLLFWCAAAEDYVVPWALWDTDLGRMLMRAKLRVIGPTELVSIGVAAEQLGVPRSTVHRWMSDRTLDYVVDHASGRLFVVRGDVENLQRIGQQYAEEQIARSGQETTAEADGQTTPSRRQRVRAAR